MATRKEFTPVFEEDESTIRSRMIGRISNEWRKEPGDFIYDAVAPSPLEVKQLQINQDSILKNAFAMFAEGQNLDYKLAEVGLTRMQKTPNKRQLQVVADVGVVIPKGHIISSIILDGEGNPLTWTADEAISFTAGATSKTVSLTCTTAGAIGNLVTGSQFMFLPTIPGVRTITDLGTTIPGTDTESDESAWARYDFKVNNPDTGGNKNDLKRWAEEVAGVGKAKVVPRWAGKGTSKIILVDAAYAPASQALVDNVQVYLDPGSTGLGDGKAPMGNQVTVTAALPLAVTITATVTWAAGADIEAGTAAFTQSITDYLKSLVFHIDPATGNNYPVVYNRIGALLSFTDGVSNYSDLLVNGGTVDLAIGAEEVPTLGGVTL